MLRRLSRTHLHYLVVGVIIVLMTPFLIGFNTARRVTVKYDGKVKEISTTAVAPKYILLAAGVILQPGDGWSFEEGHSPLKDGCVIQVLRGIEFKVCYNGQNKIFKSSKATVGEALTDIGINYRGEKIYPEANAELKAGMQVLW